MQGLAPIQLKRLRDIADSLGIRPSNGELPMGSVRRFAEALLACRTDDDVRRLFQKEPELVPGLFRVAGFCALWNDPDPGRPAEAAATPPLPYEAVAKHVLRFVDTYIGKTPR
jgi:hypothetical protein